MSKTQRPIIGFTTFALCASLTLHVTLFAAMVGYYAHTAGRIHLPGFERTAEERAVQAIYLPQPTIPADEQLGRLDGKGTAIDDVTGELEMMAKKGDQDQPFLSRDPEGPGKVHSELSESTAPMTDGASGRPGNAAPNLPFGVASIEEHSTSREETMPRGLAKENSPEVRAPNIPGEGPKPSEEQRAAAMPVPAPSPPSPQQASPQQATAGGDAGVAGATVPPADPAPKAETESDPFSTVGMAEFQRGKLTAQLGRRHRLTYPRFGIASLVEGAMLDEGKVFLIITIDPAGNVKSARVAKSSGSANIDQAWRLTAYEWWFEPKNDASGNPTKKDESFLFVVSFS